MLKQAFLIKFNVIQKKDQKGIEVQQEREMQDKKGDNKNNKIHL